MRLNKTSRGKVRNSCSSSDSLIDRDKAVVIREGLVKHAREKHQKQNPRGKDCNKQRVTSEDWRRIIAGSERMPEREPPKTRDGKAAWLPFWPLHFIIQYSFSCIIVPPPFNVITCNS